MLFDQIDESGEVQLSTVIKRILNPSDNCDEQGPFTMMGNINILMTNLGLTYFFNIFFVISNKSYIFA